MSLRRRLTTAAAGAVALAVTLVCVIAYIAVSLELRGDVDRQLKLQGRAVRLLTASGEELPFANVSLPQLSPRQGGPIAYVQALDKRGAVSRQFAAVSSFELPVEAVDRQVARSGGQVIRDVRDRGAHLRLLTVGTRAGAVQLARPLDSADTVLRRMRLAFLVIALGGVGLAAVLGRAVTRRVTQPLRDVADAAEHIAATDSLTNRLVVRSDDELGQLTGRFNTMLDRLEASRGELAASVTAQRQLVADASHELRTPITSLRTNIEVLLASRAMSAADRTALLDDVSLQLEELGALVGDIIETARGDAERGMIEDVRMDAIVGEALTRAGRHYPAVTFADALSPTRLDGEPERLARAVANLLDNAGKHTPAGGTVTVTLTAAALEVTDAGPGIADEDLPHLFDRFYRGTTARSVPGSGLGLAIVSQVASAHGGSVSASTTGSGATFRLELPMQPAT